MLSPHPLLRRARSRAGLLATLALVATVFAAACAPAASAGTSTLPSALPSTLPSDVFSSAPEPYGATPPWACSPVRRNGTAALGDLLRNAFAGRYEVGDVRSCGAANGASRSHHKSGRAIDLMVDSRTPEGRADGMALLDWLFETIDGEPHARLRRLGIVEIIWDARMWTTARDAANTNPDPSTWPAYTGLGCGSGGGATECHFDHFHFTLSEAGAEGFVSWWDPAARPAPTTTTTTLPIGPPPTADPDAAAEFELWGEMVQHASAEVVPSLLSATPGWSSPASGAH